MRAKKTEPDEIDLRSAVLGAWRTNNRATAYLIENLPPVAWKADAPRSQPWSVRTMGAHIHNSRCGWIRTLGREHGIAVPAKVDKKTVTRKQLVAALKQSGRAMEDLLRFGAGRGGRIPPTKAYVWRNLPLDLGHVLAYFVAHEGHHRGQILLLTRQMGHRLPHDVAGGVWHFTRLSKERD